MDTEAPTERDIIEAVDVNDCLIVPDNELEPDGDGDTVGDKLDRVETEGETVGIRVPVLFTEDVEADEAVSVCDCKPGADGLVDTDGEREERVEKVLDTETEDEGVEDFEFKIEFVTEVLAVELRELKFDGDVVGERISE